MYLWKLIHQKQNEISILKIKDNLSRSIIYLWSPEKLLKHPKFELGQKKKKLHIILMSYIIIV